MPSFWPLATQYSQKQEVRPGSTVAALCRGAQGVPEGALAFGAALEPVDLEGSNVILDLAHEEVAEVRIVQARSPGMAGGPPAVQVHLVEALHALDIGLGPVVLGDPGEDLHPARAAGRA